MHGSSNILNSNCAANSSRFYVCPFAKTEVPATRKLVLYLRDTWYCLRRHSLGFKIKVTAYYKGVNIPPSSVFTIVNLQMVGELYKALLYLLIVIAAVKCSKPGT